MDATAQSTAEADKLVDEVLSLPGLTGAGMRVLQALDDPDSSADDIGKLMQADQALSTRAVYIANSAFYGRANEVKGPGEAAAVLGFETVRSIAAGVAFGVFSTSDRALPQEYWDHTVAAAAATSIIAKQVGLSPGDAFSVGLLHDIGSALLAGRRPGRFRKLQKRSETEHLSVEHLELSEFGIDHVTLAERALTAARFPSHLIQAIAEHHLEPEEASSALSRVMIAAERIAHEVSAGWPEEGGDSAEALTASGIAHDRHESLIDEVREGAAELRAFLSAVKG
jgi:putative nucleotidyltransferase with HDIG domain